MKNYSINIISFIILYGCQSGNPKSRIGDLKKTILFLLFFSCALISNAQHATTLDAVQDSFDNQMEFFPQEKIHLHTDRTIYIPGENIRFKAYVVDAFSHQFPTFSQYAYVELINSSDSLVHRVMIKRDVFDLFHGHIFLSDRIPEGDYTLRAYTHYMENMGDDYFFKKNIHIGNLLTEEITRQPRRQARPDYDVSFFPEGGNLTEGILNRVAFKALNQRGASEVITGKIVDNKENIIMEISTVFAGMGSFALFPEMGKDYFLISKSSSGQEKRFKLPVVQKTYVINTIFRDNLHFIQVKKSPDMPERPLYLLIHCKGNVLYYAPWNRRNDYIAFSNEQLPAGVLQVVLLDEQNNPVSERLVFNKIKNQAKLAFSMDKLTYEKRDKVMSELLLTDMEGHPLEGNFSIAITDNNDIAIDSLYTITSSLLLSSELKGHIESPDYYLQDHKYAVNALDHLMMTHGWRRYDLSESLKGNYNRPKIGFEVAKEISGTVRGLLRRPVANSEVMLVSGDQNFLQTISDDNGKFHFDLHYPDSTQFFMIAKTKKGGENVALVLNPIIFPALKYAPVSSSLLPALTDRENENQQTEASAADFIKKAEQRAQYDENIRVINLDEIVVTASKIVAKRDEERLKYAMNAGSDYTVYRETISQFMPNQLYISSLLRLIPGVQVTPGSTGNPNDDIIKLFPLAPRPPLVYIDGVEMPDQLETGFSPFEGLFAYNVESIDVKKFASASAGGTRGVGGIISITTRKDYTANELKSNTESFSPLGYQKPIEFYSPQYDTPESKKSVFRIFVQPSFGNRM